MNTRGGELVICTHTTRTLGPKLNRRSEWLAIGTNLDIGTHQSKGGNGKEPAPTRRLPLFGTMPRAEELFPGAYSLIPCRKVKVL